MILRRHSVFFKLHLFFFLALVILALLFLFALNEQTHQKFRLLAHRSIELFQTLETMKFHTCDGQNRLLSAAGFREIPSLAPRAVPVRLPVPMQQKLQFDQLHVEIYEDATGIIYAVIRNHCTMYYRDTAEGKTYYFVWFLFFTLFAGLLSLYLLLWRNLKPLKSLYEQIRCYSEGKELRTSPQKGKDEIALISNTLFEALEKQNHLKKARELFLRNTMHELKTPITKGKLIVELEEPSPNILLLGKLFTRMEHLIAQMAEIEKMHAFALEKSSQRLDLLIANALKNLLIPDESVEVHDCGGTVFVDPALFTYALQNLIDNAHRHASLLPVRIECGPNGICIQNYGEPLKRPVEEAYEAFVTERGSGGMGLGLYIARSVCELHRFRLSYRYENGVHHFCIEPSENNLFSTGN